jgi:hypothetical protein
MIKIIAPLALAALITAPAHATCLAEYKAKRDNPLELFYGTMMTDGACTEGAARAQIQRRLATQGLTLLKVLSVSQQ